MKRLAVGLALTGCLWAAEASAQLAPGNGPIDMSADELELVDANHTAIWRGAVDAVQGQNRMRADQVTLIFNGRGRTGTTSTGAPGKNWGDVQRMEAEGNVFFVSPQQRARGDRAVYELSSGNLVMTGNVIVVKGNNVARGDRLVYNVQTKAARLSSSAKGEGTGKRVRGVFYPEPKDQAGAAAPATPTPGQP